MATIQNIQYRSFALTNGWNEWVGIGCITGHPESKDSLTCFQIIYSGMGNIMMQSFMNNDGWIRPVQNGETCGDSTHSRSIRAIRIQLVNAPGYHVFYRVCNDSDIWTTWKRDFETAGDIEGKKSIVAFEIRMAMDEPHLQYRAYIQNTGWSNFVGDNQVVGLDGKGLRMEALFIHYGGPGKLLMQAYVENKGWMTEVSNDTVCGTESQGLRLEAIRIRLLDITGYHVYYCACMKGSGWQSWVKDGEDAGMEGNSIPIEAIRIRIAM